MGINADALADLRNIHEGERIFIIGNGPSLLQQDLRPLKNEYTFTCNGMGNWQELPFEPTYYGVTDIPEYKWLEGNVAASLRWKNTERFCIRFNRWPTHDAYRDVIKEDEGYANVYGFAGFDSIDPLYTARSTPLTLAQIALWMGFREFYFLGYENSRGYVYNPEQTMSYTGRAQFNIDKNPKYSIAIQKNGAKFRMELEERGGSVVDCSPDSFMAGMCGPRRGLNAGLHIWDYKPLEGVLSGS